MHSSVTTLTINGMYKDSPTRPEVPQSRYQPRYQLSSLGRRSFTVAGPMTWNSLSADLRDPTCSDKSFRRSLKTFLFAKYWCVQCIRGFTTTMCYINRHYLSIYLSIYLSNLTLTKTVNMAQKRLLWTLLATSADRKSWMGR